MRYIIYIALALIFVCSVDGAEESRTGDIGKFLKNAEQRNPDLIAAYRIWKSSLELSSVSGYLPDPVVSLGVFLQPIETRTGPQRLNVGLRQVVPWFGKLRLKKRKSLYIAQIKWQKYQEKRYQLRFKLMKALAEFRFLKDENSARAFISLNLS